MVLFITEAFKAVTDKPQCRDESLFTVKDSEHFGVLAHWNSPEIVEAPRWVMLRVCCPIWRTSR